MTFNIRGANFPDGENVWEKRAPQARAVIEKHQPDLIGFQEFQEGNREGLRTSLVDYGCALGPESARESEYGRVFNAIYWRKDRFDCLDKGGFYLSKTPDVYSGDWGTIHNRVANWVCLHDKATGETLVHLNAHLSHISEEARIRGAQLIIERLRTLCIDGTPAIVTADFNSRTTVYKKAWHDLLTDAQKQQLDAQWQWYAYRNNVYEIFQSSGFIDTFIAAGNGDAPDVNTSHDYAHPAEHLPVNYRVDWILVWGNGRIPICSSCKIIQDAQFPVFPSDHYPVYAEVVIDSSQ